MPLYEYECANGHRFEVIQKFSDPPVEKCLTCGSPVHKLLSSPAIQFKGTGWYVTDYARKGGDGKDAKTSTSGKDSKESKETKETKTESTTTSESSSSASMSSGSTSNSTGSTNKE